MRRNSVLEGFSVRQLDDIQDEIREIVDCRSEMASEKFVGLKDIKSCVIVLLN